MEIEQKAFCPRGRQNEGRTRIKTSLPLTKITRDLGFPFATEKTWIFSFDGEKHRFSF